MKHSDFSGVLDAIKKQEMNEFHEALVAHGGTYYFIDPQEIIRQRNGEDVDDDDCPHAYVMGGSTIDNAHELIVHYVELGGDGIIRVYGCENYDKKRSYSCDWQVEQGSWFDIMDCMGDPE